MKLLLILMPSLQYRALSCLQFGRTVSCFWLPYVSLCQKVIVNAGATVLLPGKGLPLSSFWTHQMMKTPLLPSQLLLYSLLASGENPPPWKAQKPAHDAQRSMMLSLQIMNRMRMRSLLLAIRLPSKMLPALCAARQTTVQRCCSVMVVKLLELIT